MKKDNGRSLEYRREMSETLAEKGSVRVFLSSIILTLLIPIYLLVAHFSRSFGNHVTLGRVVLAVTLITQLVIVGRGYFGIVKRGMGIERTLCHVYYFITLVSCSIISGIDYAVNGSFLMYMLSTLYLVMVPIWAGRDMFVFPSIAAVANLITILAFHGRARAVVDVLLISAVAFGISMWLQSYYLEHERVVLKLRDKTISSERDPLTGLTNRRGLERRISVLWPFCMRNKTDVAIIELDIDFFKKYNDRYGHPAGDKCLKMVARAIKQSAKRNTDITARTGGEEFIIFVQGMNERELVDFAMLVRSNIADLRIPSANPALANYVTVSMGIAIATPSIENNFDVLYEKADKALYAAKNNGRNCIVYNGKIYGRMKNGLGTQIG